MNRKTVNYTLLVMLALILNACAGVSIGIPVGSVVIGTSVMGDGRVAVGASTGNDSTVGGSVGYVGQTRQHPAFKDVPDDDTEHSQASEEEADSAEAAEKTNDLQDSGEG